MKLGFTLAIVILFAATHSPGSTFVGNGGNAGDVELQVTLNQVKRTLQEVTQKKYVWNQLCACDESMEGHKICDGLKALSQSQKLYCEQVLVSSAQEMLDFINGRAGVQIIWTSQDMNVAESFGNREAIGVTQPQEKKIFFSRGSFIELRDYERIYLLTHELGHLVKIENRFLRDDEKVGPFKQNDGGRQLLNSLGAAVAMQSLANGGVSEYRKSLIRSKNYKRNWLQVSAGAENQHQDESTFAIKNYSGIQSSYRFQINQTLGLSIGGRYVKGTDQFLGIVSAENELKLYNAMLNLRLFPFSNPLSFWGQSHAILAAGYEIGIAEMKLDDGFVGIKDSAQLAAPILSVQYYLPLFVGIWFHGGLNLSTHQYEYKQIGFKSQSNQVYLNLGVSYAF